MCLIYNVFMTFLYSLRTLQVGVLIKSKAARAAYSKTCVHTICACMLLGGLGCVRETGGVCELGAQHGRG